VCFTNFQKQASARVPSLLVISSDGEVPLLLRSKPPQIINEQEVTSQEIQFTKGHLIKNLPRLAARRSR
jgi:hypothetical protein